MEAKKVHPLSKEAREQRKANAEVEEVEKTVEELYGLEEIDPSKLYEFRLIGDSGRSTQFISNRCLIFDPVLRKKRWLRYIPEEESVFEDEQDLNMYPAGLLEGEISAFAIPVARDIFEISGIERNKVLFLLLHGRRKGNEGMCGTLKKTPIFQYMDYSAMDRANRKRQEAEFEAYKVANNSSYADILPYAYVLGIDVSKGEDHVRYNFINKAKENPIEFLKEFNDPRHKRQFVVMKAFENNILTDHHIPSEIHWCSNLVKVVDVPSGERSIDYLVKYSFSAQGEKFFETLMSIVNSK